MKRVRFRRRGQECCGLLRGDDAIYGEAGVGAGGLEALRGNSDPPSACALCQAPPHWHPQLCWAPLPMGTARQLALATSKVPAGCCWELGPSLVLNLSCVFAAISVRQASLCPYDGQLPRLPRFGSTIRESTVSPDAQDPGLRKGWLEHAGAQLITWVQALHHPALYELQSTTIKAT